MKNPIYRAFFAIVKAGLWEQSVRLNDYLDNTKRLNIAELNRLANEQSLSGIVAVGLEQVQDVRMAIEDMLPIMEASLSIKAANTAMDAFIAKLFEDMNNEGVKISSVIKEGSPANVILDVAAEEDVDLIVIGSSGKSGFDRFILGSVSDKVVNAAKCPVLVVH